MTTITISKEDYLKAIAEAEAEGQTVISATLDVFYPRSIMRSTGAMTDRHSELLYFSLVTLSTIGYGDIVPLHGEVRMLAAPEGVTGVLYIAITVALLVSAYKQQTGVPPK